MADSVDGEDEDESLVEDTIQNLSDAGKYSYASLCTIVMSNMFETESDRKWRENVIKRLVKHLSLPKQVLSTLLVQMGNYESSINRSDLETAPLVATLRKEPGLSNTFAILPKDLLNLTLELGGYDSRLRVLVITLAEHLFVQCQRIESYENTLVEKLRKLKHGEPSEDLETKRRKEVMKRRKKAFLIGLGALGGGVVIGLTGGLAAPLVAAGAGAVFGGSSAAILSTTAGLALITSIFGAAGAGLTGYRLSRRIGEIEEFQFDSLNEGDQLHLTIAISGWLAEETEDVGCAFKTPWRTLNNSQEQYCLRWESRYLAELGCAMSSLLTSNSVGLITQEALKYTILSGIIAAISWPLILLQLGYAIDNPWNVCSRRAAEVGRHLAEVLLSRQQGKRPVTLVGFSMGARVIFYCLETLAKKGGEGIVEDVVLLGAPVSGDGTDWECFGRVVAGKVVNGYCRSDWFLKFVYRTASAQMTIAGLQAVNWENRRMVNVDLSTLINGHVDYADPDKMAAILEILGMNTKRQQSPPDDKHRNTSNGRIEDLRSHLSYQAGPTDDEALLVVMEIIEERIDVAMEVSSIVHQDTDLQQKGHGHVVFS